MKCHECISFTELGGCRNGRSGRKFVGWFQEACQYGEPKEAYKNKNQDTMKENETNAATQVCKDCGRELPLEEFQKGPHGYMNYCKECFKKRQKAGKQGPKPAGIAEVRKTLVDPKVAAAVAAPSKIQEEIDKKVFNPDSLPNILIAACRLEDAEIIDLVSDLCDELRERGYEVNGNIYRKYEI